MAHGVARALTLTIVTVAVTTACNLSLPSTPTVAEPPAISDWKPPAPIGSLWIYFSSSYRGRYAIGSTFVFSIAAIHLDGVYEFPGNAVTWTSSNPSVVRQLGSAWQAVSPGTATLTATMQGLSDSVTVEVVAGSSSTYPRLQLDTAASLRWEGDTSDIRAILVEDPFHSRDVKNDAIWNSSDPRVATVAAGRITAVGQGTTEISASYGGLSDSFRLSMIEAVDRARHDGGPFGNIVAGSTVTWSQDWSLRLVSAPTGTFFFALVDQNNVVLNASPWPTAVAYKPGGNHRFSAQATVPVGTTRVCSQVMLVTADNVRRTFTGSCLDVR